MISAETDRYVRENWAKLAPTFRDAHNRLRQKLGMHTLPPPKIDLYVPPRGPTGKPFDPSNPDFLQSAREFLGSTLLGPRGGEGFSINGNAVHDNAAHDLRRKPRQRAQEPSEGFTVR